MPRESKMIFFGTSTTGVPTPQTATTAALVTGSWLTLGNQNGTPLYGMQIAATYRLFAATPTGTATITLQFSDDATAINESQAFSTQITDGTATALATAKAFDETIVVINRRQYGRAIVALTGTSTTATLIGVIQATNAFPG